MDKDIFKDAKFGDKFKDGESKIYIYHYSERHKSADRVWTYHYLMREPENIQDKLGDYIYAPYNSYVNVDGYGIPSNLKTYSVESLMESPNKNLLVIGKCTNETDMEHVIKLGRNYWDKMVHDFEYYPTDKDRIEDTLCEEDIIMAYYSGYNEAKNEN